MPRHVRPCGPPSRLFPIRYSVLVAFAAILTLATGTGAQTPPSAPQAMQRMQVASYRLRLLGVYDERTGDPIAGVEVSDILGGNSSLTTVTGTVSLLFLPEGASIVRLRKVGYAMQTVAVTISPADTSPVTIVFARATDLPAVVVIDSAPVNMSAKMRLFEEHKKSGGGQYITEAELRKNDNRTLANVLVGRLPGLQSVLSKDGLSTYLTSSKKQCQGRVLTKCIRPNCYVRIFTDGALTFDNTRGFDTAGVSTPDFGRLSPTDYSAIEFYSGGAALPAGISPLGADCGTLLLYTRER